MKQWRRTQPSFHSQTGTLFNEQVFVDQSHYKDFREEYTPMVCLYEWKSVKLTSVQFNKLSIDFLVVFTVDKYREINIKLVQNVWLDLFSMVCMLKTDPTKIFILVFK